MNVRGHMPVVLIPHFSSPAEARSYQRPDGLLWLVNSVEKVSEKQCTRIILLHTLKGYNEAVDFFLHPNSLGSIATWSLTQLLLLKLVCAFACTPIFSLSSSACTWCWLIPFQLSALGRNINWTLPHIVYCIYTLLAMLQ